MREEGEEERKREREGGRKVARERRKKRTFSSSNLLSRVSGAASAAACSKLAVAIDETTTGGVARGLLSFLGAAAAAAAAAAAGRGGNGGGGGCEVFWASGFLPRLSNQSRKKLFRGDASERGKERRKRWGRARRRKAESTAARTRKEQKTKIDAGERRKEGGLALPLSSSSLRRLSNVPFVAALVVFFDFPLALLVASRLTERERERERMRQEERAREAKKEGEKRKCFSALLHSFPFPSSRRRIQLAPPPPFSVSSPSLSLSIHHGFEPQRQGRPGRGVYQGVRRALALQRQGKYFEAGIKEAIGRRRRRPLSSIVRRKAAERAPAPRGPWSSAPIFSAESMPSLRPERWRRAAV